ncbi:hypothetical protein COB52_03285 [Candidatus Kaiserbacteria bacterium]|nr:MAG: hypothetical protein COB52_03285 [Candidatus Kaiserbacteria bacterium]
MKERLSRRDVIKGAIATGLGFGASGKEALSEESLLTIKPEEINENEGEWVLVESLMSQEVPIPDGKEILGADRGLILSKSFHRFWLFDNGEVIKTGPMGSARTQDGYDTPPGSFSVTRKEGPEYMSGQYPDTDGEPNMPWAVFFNRGIAFHGSKNFHEIDGNLFLHLDNSHGCANATRDDAQLSNEILQIGDPVVVLP